MTRLVKLTVGGVPEHFNLPWHMGIESGAFSDAGIDLNYVDVPGGTGAMTNALRARELDVAIVLTEGCVADILNGNPSRIVNTYVESPLIWGIHVAGDSELADVDGIRGKRYAISRFGSGSHLMAIVDAAERNWPTDEMEFVVTGNLEGARTSLATGDADIFFWERFTTSPYVNSGEFKHLGDRTTPWPAFVICARIDVIEKEPAAINQMLDVINAQCSDLMNCSNAVATIAHRYALDDEQVRKWFSLTRWSTSRNQPSDWVTTVIDYLNELKITQTNDFKISDVWDRPDPQKE